MAKKAYSIDFKPSFIASIDEELEYWETVAPEFAKELITELLEAVDRIEKMPFIYPECRELPTKTRIYRSGTLRKQYRLIYKVRGSIIYFLAFFNTKRNPDALQKLRKNQ